MKKVLGLQVLQSFGYKDGIALTHLLRPDSRL